MRERSKLFAIFLLLVSLGQNASALGVAHPSIEVYLNRVDGIYDVNDTVKVFARCGKDLGPLRLIVLEGRDTLENKVVCFDADTEEKMIYSEVCGMPKSVMVILGPEGDDRHVTSAGYLVSPDAIRPGYKTPPDLYSWWEGEFKSLKRHRPEAKCVKVTAPATYANRVECFHVSISMPEGRAVEAYVAKPLKSGRRSIPIVIRTHGATEITSRSTRSNLISACNYAARGAVAVDINAHGMLDDAPDSYYRNLAEGELKNYSKQVPADRNAYYFRLMFLRLERLLDWICRQKDWDRKRVLVCGESQGGAQALFLAGLDPRVTHCLAIVPAMTDLGGLWAGRASSWPREEDSRLVETTSADRDIFPYFDGSLLINRFKGRLYLEAGFIDTTCPPTCIYATYNNAVMAREKTIVPFVYRRHCCVDPPYSEAWSSVVAARREDFLDAFYNGE